jgi:hypothetical protein
MAQIGTAQQAELPTWQVGDTWAIGARGIDLTPLLQTVVGHLEEQYEAMGYTDVSCSATGTLSVYEVQEVQEVQAAQYKVAFSRGASVDISMDMSLTYAGESGSGHIDESLIMKVDGSYYFTTDKLALAGWELSGDVDGEISMRMQAAGQDISQTGKIDADIGFNVTLTPPLDVFHFPITVGETWTVESDAVMTGGIAGKISAAGEEETIDEPLSYSGPVEITFYCVGTEEVELASTCYKIEPSITNGMEVLPPSLRSTSYYSPDKGSIVKYDLGGLDLLGAMGEELGLSGLGGQASIGSVNPVSEQEARDFIGGAEEGINIVLFGGIIATVIVVIALAVLVVRRRRA